MKRLTTLAVGLSAVIGVLPDVAFDARAAPPHGSVPRESLEPEGRAREIMRDYAACVVSEHRARAEHYLAIAPFRRRADVEARALATAVCLQESGELRFNLRLFRGALYEQLYHADFPHPISRGFEGIPQLAYAGDAEDIVVTQRPMDVALLDFGECVVRRAQQQVHALLQTPVASAAENAALNALSPQFSACLDAGANVHFTAEMLRGSLSEAIYKLSFAARAAGPRGP